MAGSRTISGVAVLACLVALGVSASAAIAAGTTTSPTTATSTTTETRTETRTETSSTTKTETSSTTKTRTITETPTNTSKGVVVGQTTTIQSSQDNSPPTWGWVLLGLVVLAIVLIAVLIANGRRQPPPQATYAGQDVYEQPTQPHQPPTRPPYDP